MQVSLFTSVNFCRVIAGPFCSMLLGDLGADVIKIEKPGEASAQRNILGEALFPIVVVTRD